jgi:prophage regulatory protein
MAHLPAPTPIQFLRLPEVEAVVGWKRSQIYKAVAAGEFPKQIRLSPKSVVWNAAEIAAWQAEKIEARNSRLRH